MNSDLFVAHSKNYKVSNVFNPYADTCEVCDKACASSIRRENLKAMIESCLTSGVNSMWVGRDLGYKGGREQGWLSQITGIWILPAKYGT